MLGSLLRDHDVCWAISNGSQSYQSKVDRITTDHLITC